ncbi:DUF2460 domain-containing protein [Falsirhodobacter sp. alg1]|uniref:DUF2460 domain-containing protein n=1 Tax=Falsirhodobacter sp. alg1 TaxID=1472418 RepID=UPI0005EFC57C|nr:DUF2460 domain-containing protein [Falsirhodobacter sp. alg1]
MAFHDIRFPANLSFGSVGGPELKTDIVTLANGYEERNSPWAHSRRSYDAGVGLRSLNDVDALIAFFEARRGRLHAFRWKDWSDYKSCLPSATVSPADQFVGRGDGVTRTFALTKLYRSGNETYLRPIAKPVAGTVLVAVGGDPKVADIEFFVDTSTGMITFATAPSKNAEIRSGFEFDVPVRFDTDQIQTSVSSFQAGDVPDVPVVEVRI